jgi:DNA repair protein RadC
MVREMLGRYSKLSSLAEATIQELTELTGQDRFELIRAQALIELGRRMGNSKRGDLPAVDVPEDVARRLDHLRHEKREHFVVVLLDSKGHIQRISPVHIGTVNMSIVGAREVFREAVKDGASSIIVAHNHPSGDPSPSPEDIEVTKKLVEAGKLLDIPVLDHIIIGYDDFTSLMRKGLM